MVQRHATAVWQGKGDFLSLLKADPEVTQALNPTELGALFDLEYHLKLTRVFGRP